MNVFLIYYCHNAFFSIIVQLSVHSVLTEIFETLINLSDDKMPN